MLKPKTLTLYKPKSAELQKRGSNSVACVETYETVSIITTFNDAREPPKRRTNDEAGKAEVGSGHKRYDDRITGAEHNLWAYLKTLKDNVDWTVGGPQRRRAGLLWVGRIRRLIDLKKGEDTHPDTMRACMRHIVFLATEAEIAEVADHALREAPREPDPFLIGQDLIYLDREWHSNREPRRIWPYGRSRRWVEDFLAEKDRKNERDRGRRRRAAAGATPQSESLTACARAIGKNPKTLRNRLERAGLCWADVRNLAAEAGLELPDFIRNLNKEDSTLSKRMKGAPSGRGASQAPALQMPRLQRRRQRRNGRRVPVLLAPAAAGNKRPRKERSRPTNRPRWLALSKPA